MTTQTLGNGRAAELRGSENRRIVHQVRVINIVHVYVCASVYSTTRANRNVCGCFYVFVNMTKYDLTGKRPPTPSVQPNARFSVCACMPANSRACVCVCVCALYEESAFLFCVEDKLQY